jgi:hypothetical protein
MLTVDLDRIKVIGSGSVVMKIDAKVCFPRWPSGGHICKAKIQNIFQAGRAVLEITGNLLP